MLYRVLLSLESSQSQCFHSLCHIIYFALTLAIIQQLQLHCSVAHSIQPQSPPPTPEQSLVPPVWCSRSVLHLVAGVGCLCSARGYSFSPPGKVASIGQVYRRFGNGDDLSLGGSARLLVHVGLGEKEGGGGFGCWVPCVKCLHRDGKGDGD